MSSENGQDTVQVAVLKIVRTDEGISYKCLDPAAINTHEVYQTKSPIYEARGVSGWRKGQRCHDTEMSALYCRTVRMHTTMLQYTQASGCD